MAEHNTQGCQITVVQFWQNVPCDGVLLKGFPIVIEAKTFQPCRTRSSIMTAQTWIGEHRTWSHGFLQPVTR